MDRPDRPRVHRPPPGLARGATGPPRAFAIPWARHPRCSTSHRSAGARMPDGSCGALPRAAPRRPPGPRRDRDDGARRLRRPVPEPAYLLAYGRPPNQGADRRPPTAERAAAPDGVPIRRRSITSGRRSSRRVRSTAYSSSPVPGTTAAPPWWRIDARCPPRSHVVRQTSPTAARAATRLTVPRRRSPASGGGRPASGRHR